MKKKYVTGKQALEMFEKLYQILNANPNICTSRENIENLGIIKEFKQINPLIDDTLIRLIGRYEMANNLCSTNPQEKEDKSKGTDLENMARMYSCAVGGFSKQGDDNSEPVINRDENGSILSIQFSNDPVNNYGCLAVAMHYTLLKSALNNTKGLKIYTSDDPSNKGLRFHHYTGYSQSEKRSQVSPIRSNITKVEFTDDTSAPLYHLESIRNFFESTPGDLYSLLGNIEQAIFPKVEKLGYDIQLVSSVCESNLK